MKLKTVAADVERIGVNSESTFGIEGNAKAFEILSKGLYTDSILAVIRELSCNAYDSHVEAGKVETPITVHLPTKLEPYFSVKDDGLGLCKEDVEGLYATYFASNKTNSNKVTGAFGLGSKSPFSYSKAFDVISRFDGIKNTYSVFLNEEEIPTMAELASVPTDECNGVEVKLAVRRDDFDQFRYKAAEALRFFEVQPKVTGYSSFKIEGPSENATVTDKFIVDKNSHGLTVVQGNVGYKVQRDNLDLERPVDNFLGRHGVTLFFPIGDLDVAASREEIRYDDTTVANVVKAAGVAFDDYLKKLNEEINALDIDGSKYDVFAKLQDKFTNAYNLKQTVGKYQFDSDLVNEWLKTDGTIEYTTEFKYHKIIPYKGGDVRVVKCHHNTKGYGSTAANILTPGNRVRVVHQDVTKGGSMRMNQLVSTGYNSATLLAIVPITDRALANANVTVTKRQRTVEFNKIVKMFGSPKVDKISEITTYEQAERKKRQAGNTFRRFEDDRWTRNRRAKPIFNEVTEPDEGGLYIEIDHLRNVKVGDETINWTHTRFTDNAEMMLKVINYVNDTEITLTELFGLTKKVIKNVGDNVKWISLVDVYRESVTQIKDVMEYQKRIDANRALSLKYAVNKTHFVNMVAELKKSSNFRQLLEPVIEASRVSQDLVSHEKYGIDASEFGDLRELNQVFNVNLDLVEDAYFEKDAFDEYPMLTHIDLEYNHYMEHAKGYIEMVEEVTDFI